MNKIIDPIKVTENYYESRMEILRKIMAAVFKVWKDSQTCEGYYDPD